jgi:hypothetical protein
MPSLRVRRHDQLTLAVDDLVAAAGLADGVEIEPAGGASVAISVKGRSWRAAVVSADAIGADDAHALLGGSTRGAKVVVANAISDDARLVLEGAGWSWLDRRYGLYLTHGAAMAVVRFAPGQQLAGHGRALTTLAGRAVASPSSDGPIRGRAGISYAAAVLCSPEAPPSIRRVAAVARMSPSAVGEAAKRMRDAGLLDPRGRPEIPDLFWGLAAIWQPERLVAVGSLPSRETTERLDVNPDAVDEPGWALGGDQAALAWKAPLFTTEAPPWLWVPSQAEARRAERSLGSTSWEERAAVIAVAPTALVCQPRFRISGTEWPTTHPVFIALDLARDQGRGREILADWKPEGFSVVW